MHKINTVSILGCGWYGLALSQKLLSEKYVVKGSATNQEKVDSLKKHKIDAYLISIGTPYDIDPESLFDTDVLIITIPAKENEIGLSYLQKIDFLIDKIESNSIRSVIFISSTSVYSDASAEVTERDPADPATLSGSLLAKAESKLINCTAFRTTILRFGGLYGPGRDPGKFFAGRKLIPNGLAPVNMIHLEDCVGLTMQVLKTGSFGHIFNACSPAHPSRKEFYTAAALKSNFESPDFIDEKTSWKIVSSINIPELLDYQFKVY